MAMASNTLTLRAIESGPSMTTLVYQALKQGIMDMNIYDRAADLRLDERQLAEGLGVSRTPIREAIVRLEHEGLVRTVPRRGTFVVRKTKKEILEIIIVWAALEGMGARLATQRASDEDIASLRKLFETFESGEINAHLDEYSEANLRFHQAILDLSGCELLSRLADSVLIHMRAIRRRTIGEGDRSIRSMRDHLHIIEALSRRDADLAERLVREHALGLAAHIEQNVHYLD
jgi:DNA-binding GntR family transcriptional regulator